jgi:uncharacterized membrane protein YccC
MTTTAVERPLSFAGVPASAWAFGIRIWIAIVVALAASFWLELEVPSSAALTVAILALPTRGQALDKALYRSIATLIGVTAALTIIAIFSQARDLLLAALAGWIGLCVYAAGLMDGTRAYAAVLSGYTVALVAIQQLDTPEHVFESGVARGAAIAIGIAAITVVNDVFTAPDSHPLLAARLAVLHGRIRDYAKAVFQSATSDAAAAAGLLRDVAALHPDLTSLASESSSGAVRSAAARSTAVALVAAVSAARALKALPPTADPAAAWRELARRDGEVRDGLAALSAGTRPQRTWRTPLYRSQLIAAAAGIRAAVCLALAAVFFVLAGWPTTDVALSSVAVIIGLGATAPNPNGFTVIALVAAPFAAALAGTLEFLVLDGVNEFPLLALALAPFVIGTAVLMTRPNPSLASLGRLGLVFMVVIFAPSNPQAYDPQSFLVTSLFVGVAAGLLLAAQVLVPTESSERRQHWILTSVRSDFARLLSRRDRGLAPEEAMFRDATRIAQIPVGAASPRDSAVLAEALSYFDRAAAIRLLRAQEVMS